MPKLQMLIFIAFGIMGSSIIYPAEPLIKSNSDAEGRSNRCSEVVIVLREDYEAPLVPEAANNAADAKVKSVLKRLRKTSGELRKKASSIFAEPSEVARNIKLRELPAAVRKWVNNKFVYVMNELPRDSRSLYDFMYQSTLRRLPHAVTEAVRHSFLAASEGRELDKRILREDLRKLASNLRDPEKVPLDELVYRIEELQHSHLPFAEFMDWLGTVAFSGLSEQFARARAEKEFDAELYSYLKTARPGWFLFRTEGYDAKDKAGRDRRRDEILSSFRDAASDPGRALAFLIKGRNDIERLHSLSSAMTMLNSTESYLNRVNDGGANMISFNGFAMQFEDLQLRMPNAIVMAILLNLTIEKTGYHRAPITDFQQYIRIIRTSGDQFSPTAKKGELSEREQLVERLAEFWRVDLDDFYDFRYLFDHLVIPQ